MITAVPVLLLLIGLLICSGSSVVVTAFSASPTAVMSNTAFFGSARCSSARRATRTMSSYRQAQRLTSRTTRYGLVMRVVDIDSEAAFDNTIKSAGNTLVVIDYSTTWCGPCKVIAPKFDELSDKYPDAVFLKVIGDATPDASKLMKREGVRSVPSFHYFVNGDKVEVVNGANAEAIESAINKHIPVMD